MTRHTLGLLALTFLLQMLLGLPFIFLSLIALRSVLPPEGWERFVIIWAISFVISWVSFGLVNCHVTHAVEERC
jgi:hypothetical protein